MPIRGLTDRGAAFPQIGVLRKGAPKPERGPGRDLNHFRFDSDDADALRAFTEVYGAEPRAIRVFMPYRTVAENFEAWQEEWSAGSLLHRCDGVTCVRWQMPNGKYSDAPKPCPGKCKPAGRLKVIIPELRRLAYVMVLTTSIHDVITLQENLEALESARGDLRGIPMILRRVAREISMPDDRTGKRVRREKWLLHIEAQPQWVDLQIAEQQQRALPQSAPLALPSPAEVAAYIDPNSGEMLDEAPAAQPAAPETAIEAEMGAPFEKGTIGAVVEQVETAYSKSGKLTLKLTLGTERGEYTAIYVGAPEELIHMEPGDAVVVTGELKTHRGMEVIEIKTISDPTATAGQLTNWQQRAAAEAQPIAA